MKEYMVLLFATAGGLTMSGITASLYRMMARKPESRPETLVYYAVMVFAGPSVLFENATKSFRTKDCTVTAYAFAVAITGYWAFAIGILALSLYAGVL